MSALQKLLNIQTTDGGIVLHDDFIAEWKSKPTIGIVRAAAAEFAAKNKALETCVMFLTNANTITVESQTELCKQLNAAGCSELADAVGGFADAVNDLRG